MISPCFECMNRHPGCHADCEVYAAYKAEQKELSRLRAERHLFYTANSCNLQEMGRSKMHPYKKSRYGGGA